MEIDKDIQKAIYDYVESINDKEEELLSFKNSVDVILSESENKLEEIIKTLDKDFNNNKIDEDIYLNKMKESKKQIIKDTQVDLDNLLKGLS